MSQEQAKRYMETYLRTHYIAVPLFSMLQLQEVEEVRVPEANEPDKVRRLPFQFVRICECIGGNWEEEEGNMVGAMVELDGCLLQIHVYQYDDEGDGVDGAPRGCDVSGGLATFTRLPCKPLEGLWERYVSCSWFCRPDSITHHDSSSPTMTPDF